MEPLVAPLLSLLLLAGTPFEVPPPLHTVLTTAPGADVDGDSDGVPDGADLCPETDWGYPVDASGCETDTDADGVPDGRDRCTRTAPGSIGVDRNGCSVRDLKRERAYRFPVGLA